jgi:hypothetical protein
MLFLNMVCLTVASPSANSITPTGVTKTLAPSSDATPDTSSPFIRSSASPPRWMNAQPMKKSSDSMMSPLDTSAKENREGICQDQGDEFVWRKFRVLVLPSILTLYARLLDSYSLKFMNNGLCSRLGGRYPRSS